MNSILLPEIDQKLEACWQQRYENPQDTLEAVKELAEQSAGLGYEKGMACAKALIAICSFLLSAEDEILQPLLDSNAYFKNSHEAIWETRTLYFLANIYENYGNYGKALELVQSAIKKADELGYAEGSGDAYSVLGLVYSRLCDYKSALQAYELSYKVREQLGDLKAMASSLNLLARTFTSTGDYEKGIELYNKSLKIREELNQTGAIPWTWLGLASLYERKNELDKAIELYNKSIGLSKKTGDIRCDMHCCLGLGKIYFKLKDFNQAEEQLNNALKIAEELKFSSVLMETHQILSELFEQKEDSFNTILHLKEYHRIKETTLNTEITNKLKHQQIQFAVEKSEQEAEIFRLKNVELKQLNEKLAEYNRDINDSITSALRIQEAILPSFEHIKSHLAECFVFYQPRSIVSGDFYFIESVRNKIVVAAADCTGHGVPGAFMSFLGYTILREIITSDMELLPSLILNHLGNKLQLFLRQSECKLTIHEGMDISLCVIDKKLNEIYWGGAFNPLYRINNQELTEYEPDKHMISGTFDNSSFTDHFIPIQKNDTFYLFSDGYKDQFGGPRQKKYMSANFKELLKRISTLSMPEQHKALHDEFFTWKGEREQIDDVMVMGFKVK